MLTIVPPPRCTIFFATADVRKNGPRTHTSMILSQSAGVVSQNSPVSGGLIPALLTRMSSSKPCSSMRASSRSIPSIPCRRARRAPF